MKYLILFLSGVMLCAVLSGCSKKDTIAPYIPTDSIGRINKWILDSLKRFYYWSDEIPAKPDFSKSPEAFFKSVLSVNDRFSWISNGIDIQPPSNSYFTYGFHYALVDVAGHDGLVGVVTIVNKGGVAESNGMQRGAYFLTVNGAAITTANMDAVKAALQTAGSVDIGLGVYENGQWKTTSAVTLASAFSYESPVQHIRTFAEGGIKTGYLYYNSFNEGYDGALIDAVGKLKDAGISELILDLRYNAGGNVSSSAKLACLIAKKLTGNETYAIFSGNRYEGRSPRSLQSVLNTSGNPSGRSYEELKGRQLSLQRVFILTTQGTVSAAELIVNSLKPFLQVVQIGEATKGKDEAGFVISDNRNPPQVEWYMEPTVYKLFNKNNEGNYSKGLIPQYAIDELSQLPINEVGVTADPLVHKALEIIYGAQVPEDYNSLGIMRQRIKARAVYRSIADAAGDRPMRVSR